MNCIGRWQNNQSPDLGHGRPGALPGDHVGLLPGRGRRPARVRHRQTSDVRERGAVAARAARPRRPEHRDYAGRQQERPAAPARGTDGRGEGLRRTERPQLHRDVGARLDQR